MKKLLLTALLFSMSGAFGMQENESAPLEETAIETVLPVNTEVQLIKNEISPLQRSARWALGGALVSGALVGGVGAVEFFKGNGSSDRLVKFATVAGVCTVSLAYRPLNAELTKFILNAEQKAGDKLVETVFAYKKTVIAGAVVAGGLAAYYTK